MQQLRCDAVEIVPVATAVADGLEIVRSGQGYVMLIATLHDPSLGPRVTAKIAIPESRWAEVGAKILDGAGHL